MLTHILFRARMALDDTHRTVRIVHPAAAVAGAIVTGILGSAAFHAGDAAAVLLLGR